MTSWHNLLKFEAAKYAGYRLSHIRKKIKAPEDSDDEFNYIWYRDVSIYRVSDIDYIISKYGLPDIGRGPDDASRWSLYVSGFTFDWSKFIKENGRPPSFISRKLHTDWRENVLKPNLAEFILKKDLVFEIDRKKGEGLRVAGNVATAIIECIHDKGMLTNDTHVMFSGRGGYHVIIPDVEQYFDDFGVDMYKRTIKALSHGAISVAQQLLDEIYPGDHIRDGKGQGRDYEEFDIHFSPMYPQGVRRCAYELTEYGTISFPVTLTELEKAGDVNFYRPGVLLNNYRISGRGCPKVM